MDQWTELSQASTTSNEHVGSVLWVTRRLFSRPVPQNTVLHLHLLQCFFLPWTLMGMEMSGYPFLVIQSGRHRNPIKCNKIVPFDPKLNALTHAKAGYKTKRGSCQNYASLFSMEWTISFPACAISDLDLDLESLKSESCHVCDFYVIVTFCDMTLTLTVFK